jgi:hypothetical protein
VPRGNKQLFLWDEAGRRKLPVQGRAYWFNDFDYHGVEALLLPLLAAGRWRLHPAFLERLRRDHSTPSSLR